MSEFEPLGLDDVICARFFSHPTFQAREMIEFLENEIMNKSNTQRALAVGELECQVLSSTNNRTGWVKGTVRLHMALEFCPDVPEAIAPPENNDLLDEFR